jgi:carbonic anhydrase/acetyltransferase-like protein (isoleucine patch superfamily)
MSSGKSAFPFDLAFHPERIDPTVWVADGAIVRGDVTVGRLCTIWYGAILRGEIGPIVLGARTNIQDGAIVHAETGDPVAIGDDVTLGHGAVVHAACVGDRSLIAIRATVLTGAVIGEECIIGAGALVPPGKVIPPRSMVLGVPGKVVRLVTDEDVEGILATAAHHVHFARVFKGRVTE